MNEGQERENEANIQHLMALISTREFDIEELYAQYHDSWQKYHLDQLALVVAGECIDSHDFYDKNLYFRLEELCYLLGGDEHMRLLLTTKWIPKLQQAEFNEQEVFELVHQHTFLKLVLDQIRAIVIPLIRDLPDTIAWCLLLECKLLDSIDLLQETISESAPVIPADLVHIPDHSRVISTCLKVWAAAANHEQLSRVDLAELASFGLTQTHVCDIFASALSTRWSLGEMVTRYTIISNFDIEPNASLDKAMVYTLNCINAVLDRSGAVPPLTFTTQQVTLDQLLLNWCMEKNIHARPDPQDRRRYHLTKESSIVVCLKDNLFWIDDLPVEIDQLEAMVSR